MPRLINQHGAPAPHRALTGRKGKEMVETGLLGKILVRMLALALMLFGPVLIPISIYVIKSATCNDGRYVAVAYYSDLWEMLKDGEL